MAQDSDRNHHLLNAISQAHSARSLLLLAVVSLLTACAPPVASSISKSRPSSSQPSSQDLWPKSPAEPIPSTDVMNEGVQDGETFFAFYLSSIEAAALPRPLHRMRSSQLSLLKRTGIGQMSIPLDDDSDGVTEEAAFYFFYVFDTDDRTIGRSLDRSILPKIYRFDEGEDDAHFISFESATQRRRTLQSEENADIDEHSDARVLVKKSAILKVFQELNLAEIWVYREDQLSASSLKKVQKAYGSPGATPAKGQIKIIDSSEQL